MRRWVIRLLLIMLACLLAAAVAVQIVLRSDLPRQRVVEATQRELGLLVDVRGFRATWSGESTLSQTVISLPMDDQPFLMLPSLRMRHTGIIAMLMGQSVNIESIEVDVAQLRLHRDAAGRWNLLQVLEVLRQRREGVGGAWTAPLPQLLIRNATVTISIDDRPPVRVAPLSFHGRPRGEVAWDFQLQTPDRLDVSGRLAIGGEWRHQVALELRHFDDIVALLLPEMPLPLALRGEWNGRLGVNGLQGEARVTDAAAGDYRLSGPFALRREAHDLDTWLVLPRDMEIYLPQLKNRMLHWRQGLLALNREQAALREVSVQVPEVDARLTGVWRFHHRTGEVNVAWSGQWRDPDVRHEGRLQLALVRPAPQRTALSVELATHGQSPLGVWRVRLDGEASGARDDLTWRLSLPEARFEPLGAGTIRADGLVARGSTQWPRWRIDDIAVATDGSGGGQVRGSGEFDAEQRDWQVSLSATNWMPRGTLTALDLLLSAHGDSGQVRVTTLKASTADASIDAAGSYHFHADEPLDLTFSAQGAAEAFTWHEPIDAQGQLRLAGRLRGTVEPLHLMLDAELAADQLRIASREMHPLRVPLTARFSDGLLTLRSEAFEFLDGLCRLGTDYRLDDPDVSALRVRLEIERASLQVLAKLVNDSLDVDGRVCADLQVALPLAASLDHLGVSGSAAITQLRMAQLEIDEITGHLSSQGGEVRMEPLHMTLREGRVSGSASFDLREGERIFLRLRGERWPLEAPQWGLAFEVGGDAALWYDLSGHSLSGQLAVVGDAWWQDRALASFEIDSDIQKDQVTLTQLSAAMFGGRVTGSAMLKLDDWYASTGAFTWDGLRVADIRAWWPGLIAEFGHFAGALRFGPTQIERPFEPMDFELTLEPSEDLLVRDTPLGRTRLIGHAGPTRVLVQEASMAAADGQLIGWVAMSRHADAWYSQVQLELSDVDLEVVRHALNPEGDPVVGRVSGNMRAVGRWGDWGGYVGGGDLRIERSDLVDAKIIGPVFHALGFSGRQREPGGTGAATLRLEHEQLWIDEFTYLNRGAELFGAGVFQDLRLGAQTPVDFFVMNSDRPLKDLKLPGTRWFDRLFSRMQSSLRSFHITGTFEQNTVQLISFKDARSTIDVLLGGRRDVEPSAPGP